jgi:ADP-ribose pyrophosphatase
VLELRLERAELPNGRVLELEVVRHRGAAAIVPIDEDGSVLLIRQYRYAPDAWLLEVPAGTLSPQEAPEACAARELIEETGYSARELVPLGSILTTPGFTDERIWLYLARGLEARAQQLDGEEILSVERLAWDDALRRVESGEICDAKTICALHRARPLLAQG